MRAAQIAVWTAHVVLITLTGKILWNLVTTSRRWRDALDRLLDVHAPIDFPGPAARCRACAPPGDAWPCQSALLVGALIERYAPASWISRLRARVASWRHTQHRRLEDGGRGW